MNNYHLCSAYKFQKFDIDRIWEKFKYYELVTVLVRQKDQIPFIAALANFIEGKIRAKNLQLLNTRNIDVRNVIKYVIQLFRLLGSQIA